MLLGAASVPAGWAGPRNPAAHVGGAVQPWRHSSGHPIGSRCMPRACSSAAWQWSHSRRRLPVCWIRGTLVTSSAAHSSGTNKPHAAAGNRDTWMCRALEAVRSEEHGHGFGGGAAPHLASSYRTVALTGPSVHQQVAPWFLQQQQGTTDGPATDRNALDVPKTLEAEAVARQLGCLQSASQARRPPPPPKKGGSSFSFCSCCFLVFDPQSRSPAALRCCWCISAARRGMLGSATRNRRRLGTPAWLNRQSPQKLGYVVVDTC